MKKRRFSIGQCLVGLVFLSVLPGIIIALTLVYQAYAIDKAQTNHDALILVRNLTAKIDKQLAEAVSGLEVLAISRSLSTGQLDVFQAHATRALPYQQSTNNVLLDEQGRQLVNTLLPFGNTLPDTRKIMRFQQIFETGKPLVTDIFKGPVTGNFTWAIGVPVLRNGTIAYALTAAFPPSILEQITSSKNLPTGWTAVIVDGSGAIMSRTRDTRLYVGQKAVPALLEQIGRRREGVFESINKEGTPIFSAYSHSSASNWTVAVGVPKSTIVSAVYERLFKISAGALAALLIGGTLAAFVGNRIAAEIGRLRLPAAELGEGNSCHPIETWLEEVHSIAMAFTTASGHLDDSRKRANFDTLTGLSRRPLFHELISQQIVLATRHKRNFAILVIDLDNFKLVNDTQGHASGDYVLKQAADRMLASIRASDVTARLGGDEFAVLLVDVDEKTARKVAQKICFALGTGYQGITPRVSASIGIAMFPQSAMVLSDLLAAADLAMYEAKSTGKSCVAMSTSKSLNPSNAEAASLS